jgi:hypothetical protein
MAKERANSPSPAKASQVSGFNFFEIAIEIRLKIYSEILVHSEPIDFVANHRSSPPSLLLSKREGLCPALLRANKKVHGEASSLLYSVNRFRFPDIYIPTSDRIPSWPYPPYLHYLPYL